MLVGLEGPGDGLLNTITYLTDEICSLGATHFKHHSGFQVKLLSGREEAGRWVSATTQHGIEAGLTF